MIRKLLLFACASASLASPEQPSHAQLRRRTSTQVSSSEDDLTTRTKAASSPVVNSHNFRPRYLEQELLAGREVDLSHYYDSCGTKSPTAEEMSQMNQAVASWKSDPVNQRRRLQDTNYVVPVYMHVLKKSSQQGGLSQDSMIKFIDTLNKGFRDSSFTFVLSDVREVINATWHVCSDEEGFKEALRVNGTDVLNVYVCDTHARSAGQIGYSYYPPSTQESWRSLDGVVIMNPDLDVFEDSAVYNGLVHEVGHFLGLAHTFEGGCSTEVVNHWGNRASYKFSGDGVADTPAHAGATFGQSVGLSTCWQSTKVDTCDDASGCDPGPDPVSNYMNVIPGTCYENYGEFTSGQLERMVAQYETFRYRGIVYEPSDFPVFVYQQQPSSQPVCQKRREACKRTSDCCVSLKCNANKRCVRK